MTPVAYHRKSDNLFFKNTHEELLLKLIIQIWQFILLFLISAVVALTKRMIMFKLNFLKILSAVI